VRRRSLAAIAAIGAALLGLTACDPIWRVSLSVRDPADRPVPDASVIVVCPERPHESGVERTAPDGTASLGGMGTSLPPGCTVGIARPGYATRRTSFEAMCRGRATHECDRVREERVVLEPVTPPAPTAR
jgi:hypothetical protein